VPEGVQINTDEVGDFAKQVRNQADGQFEFGAQRGKDLHAHGVVFGANFPGGVIFAAKQKYAQALEHLDANLRTYQAGAQIFAEVAERIARDFANVDMASAQAQKQVESLMTDAVNRVNALPGMGALTQPAQPSSNSTAQEPW
jgi:hypothetical protein